MIDDPRILELRRVLPSCMLGDWVRLGSRLVRLLRDRNHPGQHGPILDRLVQQARASVALRERRRERLPPVDYPPGLPIVERREDILAAIRSHPVTIVAGETGSGKTTQLPKMCLEAGFGIEATIGCTQPRRVAALSISRRIAEELNVEWGREVGCKIRFDDRSGRESHIKLMTDGVLLAETQGDPLLSEYHVLILDEAHERSLNIDFLLGYLKGLLSRRTDLKLIITSATIDTAAFSQAFGGAPVIEVSGRVYPVETVYQPLDPGSEEQGDWTYLDAAASSVESIAATGGDGDVLVFLPGERDIRELKDVLEGRLGESTEIIPLFGRLSSGEQQRVFALLNRRKVVLATNIAETSLTLPGIRYVVDSGLARVSRYSPRTRTRRLPVEPISQSSANQRKGRAGRVRDGICIRLYSEEDFCERPVDTQPEIQRANLAEVILRMKAFRLGEIETFPFLNPPSPAAIDAGYELLQELGALDEERRLTATGSDLARLPIDPTLGRMLLQSQQEHAARELLIIASGLSIQDPRERPLDQRDAADAMHRQHADPSSDFLTLLNLWNAFHEAWEALRTQNQRRRFCRSRFLSYVRMREWQDLHAQLHGALEELGTLKINESNAHYDAIHRSILAGLPAQVARRLDRNLYQGPGNRQLTLFPGSGLHQRTEPAPRKNSRHPETANPAPKPSRQPGWIVAGEWVQTSQLFARTVAGIDPLWLLDVAPHLCRVAHFRPRWSARSGRVIADETTSACGFEIRTRSVSFGRVDPQGATAIFIREALIAEELLPPEGPSEEDGGQARPGPGPAGDPRAGKSEPDRRPPARYAFLERNRQLRERVEMLLTRVRRRQVPDLDAALFEFYRTRLEGVSSLQELDRLLGEQGGDRGFLCARESDFVGAGGEPLDDGAFPESVQLGGEPVEVRYAYAPGEDRDGVTVRLPFSLAQTVADAAIEWAVPGLREEKAGEMLRSLPKALRKQLMPLAPKIADIVQEFRPSGRSFSGALGRFIQERYGLVIPPGAWSTDVLPAHLRPRIEIVGTDRGVLGSGRDLGRLRTDLAAQGERSRDQAPAWKTAVLRWERYGLTGWAIGDVPERIAVSDDPGAAVYAWPGLQIEEGAVSLRLFATPVAARRESSAGLRRLAEKVLDRDLGWLERDLQPLQRLGPKIEGWITGEALHRAAMRHLTGWLLPIEPLPALNEAAFEGWVASARSRIPGLVPTWLDRLNDILELRLRVGERAGSGRAKPAPQRALNDLRLLGAVVAEAPAVPTPLKVELDALLPADFLDRISFERLAHLPRYLKALLIRADRAALNPAKDAERARLVAPYADAMRSLKTEAGVDAPEVARELEELRWMIQEYRVSLFAQELGTALPVSPKRLDAQLERVRAAQRADPGAVPPGRSPGDPRNPELHRDKPGRLG